MNGDLDLRIDSITPVKEQIEAINLGFSKLNQDKYWIPKKDSPLTFAIKKIKNIDIEVIKQLIHNVQDCNEALSNEVIYKNYEIFKLVFDNASTFQLSTFDLKALPYRLLSNPKVFDDISNYIISKPQKFTPSTLNLFVATKRLGDGQFVRQELEKSGLDLKSIPEISDSLFKLDKHLAHSIFSIENYSAPHTSIEWVKSMVLLEEGYTSRGGFEDITKGNLEIIEKVKKMEEDARKNEIDFKEVWDFINQIKARIYSKENIASSIDSLAKKPELKEVLEILALNWREFKITFSPDTEISEKVFRDGGMNFYGKEIVMTKTNPLFSKEQMLGTLVHEAWHAAMYYVFKNHGNPYEYSRDDKTQQIKFSTAVNETLSNIFNLKCEESTPKPNLNNTFELGKFIASNCKKPLDGNLETVADAFLSIYRNYELSDEHVEFVVRHEQLVAQGTPEEDLNILEPLANYIEEFIKPEMRKYIENHPANYSLKPEPFDPWMLLSPILNCLPEFKIEFNWE